MIITASRLRKARERLQKARDDRAFESNGPTWETHPEYQRTVALIRKKYTVPADALGEFWRVWCNPWHAVIATLREDGDNELADGLEDIQRNHNGDRYWSYTEWFAEEAHRYEAA